jgi:Tol biopolymer transport system component
MVPSYDGRSFVAVIQEGQRKSLQLYSISDGRLTFVRQLAPFESPGTGRDAQSAIWSPDGRSVVVAVDHGVRGNPPRTEVWRYPLTGSQPERLFEVNDRMILNSVHPSGRRFAFLRANRPSSELWSLELGRGMAR